MELERSRAVRMAEDAAQDALESAERSAMALRKQELAASAEVVATLAEKGVVKAHDKLMEAVDMVRGESARLLELERAHELRQQKVGSTILSGLAVCSFTLITNAPLHSLAQFSYSTRLHSLATQLPSPCCCSTLHSLCFISTQLPYELSLHQLALQTSSIVTI